jgi:hypothetical protein
MFSFFCGGQIEDAALQFFVTENYAKLATHSRQGQLSR